MTANYDEFFEYGPSIGQEVTVEYTLVAAAASSQEEARGTITEANDTRLIIEQDRENGADLYIREKYGGLQVFSNGGRLGPVQGVTEH